MRKPPGTRQHIRLLGHRRPSGLFLPNGEYIANTDPNHGGRVIRKLGTDFAQAGLRFEALLVELDEAAADVDSPRVADFLVSTFLPTQRRLKSYAHSAKSVGGVVRFVEETAAQLRLHDVGPQNVERVRTFCAEQDCAPRTVNIYTQELKHGLNHAADVGVLPANPIARVKTLRVDNRRTKFL